nr:MAG TPA: hypothetical protein [Caudoviricetes sp.]
MCGRGSFLCRFGIIKLSKKRAGELVYLLFYTGRV